MLNFRVRLLRIFHSLKTNSLSGSSSKTPINLCDKYCSKHFKMFSSGSSSCNSTNFREQFEEIQIPESKNPMDLWESWYKEAMTVSVNKLPQAMSVSTVQASGRPASRTLLMRGYDVDKGFQIYTCYDSPKAEDLQNNPYVALVFLWYFTPPGETEPIGARQVRVEGLVSKLPDQTNDEYFQKETLGAQIRAIIQHQSKCMDTNRKEEMIKMIDDIHKQIESDPNYKLSRPLTYGGYLIQPDMMEFYQGTPKNLASRLKFILNNPPATNTTGCEEFVGGGEGAGKWKYEYIEL